MASSCFELSALGEAAIQADSRSGNIELQRVVWRRTGPPETGQLWENVIMSASSFIRFSVGAAVLLLGCAIANPVHAKPFMIVGLDEKILWDDDGKPIFSPDGKDQVLIVDLANP